MQRRPDIGCILVLIQRKLSVSYPSLVGLSQSFLCLAVSQVACKNSLKRRAKQKARRRRYDGPLARHYVQPGTHCQISTMTRKGAESNLMGIQKRFDSLSKLQERS
jgi:hypothetical protein